MLVALAAIVWFLTRLLPTPKDKTTILSSARVAADALKKERELEHAVAIAEMDIRNDELKNIKANPDEKERLQALADFANRNRKRPSQ